jgi:hypothetical protein
MDWAAIINLILADLPQVLAFIDQIIALFQNLNPTPTPATADAIKQLQALKVSLSAMSAAKAFKKKP